MNNEIIFIIEESSEGGYEAKALGHSIYIEAGALGRLRAEAKDAVTCHFDDAERPKIIRLSTSPKIRGDPNLSAG